MSSSSTERATSLVQGKVIRNVAPRNITPMKVPGKRKCRHSNEGVNDDARRKDTESGHTELMQVTRTHSDSVPAGCTWASNSCPYDSILFVLANAWKSKPVEIKDSFADINAEWFGSLAEALYAHIEGSWSRYSLEQVRDFMRRKLHRAYPTVFVYGRETSPSAIMERWFRRESPVSRISNTCVADHEIDDVISMS